METGYDETRAHASNSFIRKILLSSLLVYFMILNMKSGLLETALLGVLVTILAFILVWKPEYIIRRGPAAALSLVILIGTLSYWIMYGLGGNTYFVIFFLIGWATYRLPQAYSAAYTLLNIAVSVILWFIQEKQSVESVLAQCMVLTAVYLLLWAGRLRRETRMMKEEHLKELTTAHQQLETAYSRLRQAHEELEETSEQALRYAVLEERSRIAADIHDSIGHGLTSVIVQLQALPYMIEASPEEAGKTLRNVTEVARECLQDVRTVVHEMGLPRHSEGILELKNMTVSFSEQNGLPVSFAADVQGKIPSEQIYVLYRVLQEALTNILRHARATRAEVVLSGTKDGIVMSIRDDGQAQGPVSPGFGLSAMKARCGKAGGALRIEPLLPHGLEIRAELPTKSEPLKPITEGNESYAPRTDPRDHRG